MGIQHSEVNYDNLINNLGNCCLTEERCGLVNFMYLELFS